MAISAAWDIVAIVARPIAGELSGALLPVMTSADLVELLKQLAPTDWPRIWSAVYGHREAAVQAVVDE